MKFEVPGVAAAFADLTAGSLFFVFKRSKQFGICVSLVGQKKGAIMLSTPAVPDGPVPWLARGGLSQDALVSFPAAVLRASHADITSDIDFGYLISAAGNFYIRAADQSLGDYGTFNLGTGQQEPLPQEAMTVAYSRWSIGIVTDGNFDPIFSFTPPSAALA
jgi:hypothetical protein